MYKFGVVFILLTALVTGATAEERIVFQGGDTTVSYADMERYIEESTPPDPGQKASVLNRPGVYREMAEMLYTLQVITAEAESQLDFDQEQAKWMAWIMYQRRMVNDYRRKYTREMLKDVNWDALARETYLVEKEQYISKERVKASHILIKTKIEGRSDEEARALAAGLRERVLDGEDFEELARQFSEDPSAARNGGNLGYFQRGQMVESFENVAFAMQEPGEISEVVESPFGYHVIQYHSRRAPEPIPFEKVKKKIIDDLQTQMSNKVWQDKLIAIRSDSDIVVDDELLAELKNKYQTKVTPQ